MCLFGILYYHNLLKYLFSFSELPAEEGNITQNYKDFSYSDLELKQFILVNQLLNDYQLVLNVMLLLNINYDFLMFFLELYFSIFNTQ